MLLMLVMVLLVGFGAILAAHAPSTPATHSVRQEVYAQQFLTFKTAVMLCAEKEMSAGCAHDWRLYLPDGVKMLNENDYHVEWSAINSGAGANIVGSFDPGRALGGGIAADLSRVAAPANASAPRTLGVGGADGKVHSADYGVICNASAYPGPYKAGRLYFCLTLDRL
jgi:hypothetical protein